jgi:nucleoside-diphosphate-sugar epimerase
MNKVLITGATGFIGSFLCENFASHGYDVLGMIRNPSKEKILSKVGVPSVVINNISSDTDWHSALKSVKIVIHAAARVHKMKEEDEISLNLYHEMNTLATLNLVEQAIEAGVEHFIFLSSIKVNGEQTFGCPFDETMEPNPQDPYGVSKYEAEQLIEKKCQNSNMRYTILRLPLVYGVGVKANFSKLLNLVRRGWPLPLSNINNKRSLLYIGNLFSAILTCVRNPDVGSQLFCLSDNDDVSTSRLAKIISNVFNTKTIFFPLPSAIFILLGKLIKKSSTVERLVGSLQVNSAKIRKVLGWNPPYAVESALDEMSKHKKNTED